MPLVLGVNYFDPRNDYKSFVAKSGCVFHDTPIGDVCHTHNSRRKVGNPLCDIKTEEWARQEANQEK